LKDILIFDIFINMKNKLSIDKIIEDISLLRHLEKLELLERLVGMLKKDEIEDEPANSILDLKGLGKEIWQKINVDEYLEKERNSWL
jgi:hypothetical protein